MHFASQFFDPEDLPVWVYLVMTAAFSIVYLRSEHKAKSGIRKTVTGLRDEITELSALVRTCLHKPLMLSKRALLLGHFIAPFLT